MKYTPIVGTLGFILSKDKRSTLLVNRTYNTDDDHFGKYNGLGGKMESTENVVECMRREIQEEAGIITTSMTLRGTMNWTGFGPNEEDWLAFIFLIDDYTGTINTVSPEGPLSFHLITSLPSLPMWEGDRKFLPLVFDTSQPPFHGYMPYDKGSPQDFRYSR